MERFKNAIDMMEIVHGELPLIEHTAISVGIKDEKEDLQAGSP